ncbi:MAG: rhodanese-like domain-containing protein [Desulfotalea sp.]
MKLRMFIGASLLVSSLVFGGCAQMDQTGSESLTTPSVKVQQLVAKHQLQIVDYQYAKEAVGKGTRNGARALLIDARPNAKYLKGTIPSSINIPDNKIPEYIGQLNEVAKDKEILVFCGGWGCAKSPKVAGYLKGIGFTNVKLYQAGEPEWKTKSYLEVGIPVVESALEKNSALLMDARPRAKYLSETIPGAMYMNNTELDKLAARFPIDKSTPIITFCGGYNCSKSHAVADALLAQEYTNVRVFSGGLPAWKKAGMRTTASAKKVTVASGAHQEPVFVDGVKLGADEGTVDGEWLNSLIKKGNVPVNVILVDVRETEDYVMGHLAGSMNIFAEKLTAAQLAAKLPKNKIVVFYCSSGARAMEAFLKLEDAKKDVSKVMYFDANINCKGSACKVEVNEPLG